MHTITLADVLTTEIRPSRQSVDVKLTAELYVDHKRPKEKVVIVVTPSSVIAVAHDDQLTPRIAVSRELVHAARLFGKML